LEEAMPTVAVPKSFTYHTSLDNVIGRTGVAHSDVKPELRVVAPPEFKGEPGLWTPEDLFVVSLESCLMLTFAGIAEKRGLRVVRYESSAEGLLDWLAGSYQFTRVVVRPRITVPDPAAIVAAREIVERAHETCLVANSVRTSVIVEPEFVVE
jgi:organic hydroperoxide reductase OsmC/OhrA